MYYEHEIMNLESNRRRLKKELISSVQHLQAAAQGFALSKKALEEIDLRISHLQDEWMKEEQENDC